MANAHVHQGQPVLSYGTALARAQAIVLLLHGRGSTAQNILGLATRLPQGDITYLAPQAANQTWYPRSGFIPLEDNEPYVSSAFQVIAEVLAQIADAGIAPSAIALGGFSQGACLTAEYVARHPKRYGGLFVLSGALMGPPDMPRQYPGSLDGMPVYVGGCDHDPWVTEHQLRLTGRVLQEMGGMVDVHVQTDTGHMIRPPDVTHVSKLISELATH